ncbi:MAG: hypothetical protein J5912_05720 [Clostridia bacterium]|nr:hypothetical protein [Clostridia bacterium]
MASFTKKLLAVVICTVILASTFAGLSHAANTIELYNDSSSSKKTTVTFDEDHSFGGRFNAGAEFTKAGIEINISSNGKKVSVSLYKWAGSVRDSKKDDPVARTEYSKWNKGDVLSVSNGSAIPAGEYYLEIYTLEGSSYKFNMYTPASATVMAYVDGYAKDATPFMEIETTASKSSFVKNISASQREPAMDPPAEPEIAADSMIAQLGVDPTQWTAVDGLGRTLPLYSETGYQKQNKTVGIFYWTWHEQFSGNSRPANVTAIFKENPNCVNNYTHKIWDSYKGCCFWWNEPVFGYYKQSDDYVLRKHAEMLADAGIDFVLFDCTNGDNVFTPQYMNVLKVWSQARAEGVKTPKVSFMLPFWDQDYTLSSLKQLFHKMYKNGLYRDLWYYLDGKPMIMGISEMLDENDDEQRDIKNFFTFRQGEPSYWLEDKTNDYWGWLHIYPQALYKRADGTVEQTTVGVAQNANYETRKLSAMNSGHNMGRGYSEQKDFSYTYTYRGKDVVCSSSMENAHYYGINFQEQWNYALSVDPDIIFVTGWNEWTAGRYEEWGGVKNAFPDQCDDANSRDCEPSKGDLKDYYYYQLAANVRKFKGASATPYAKATQIDINNPGDAWSKDTVVTYNHYYNNTYVRDNDGMKGVHYTNPGIRNDFVTLKATFDSENLYFYAETAADITPYTDENWMRLILDTQAATEDSTDWENFEYIIGRETGTDSTLALERSTGGWNWEKVGDVRYTVNGKVMQIAIPRSMVGAEGDEFQLSFKWADANLTDGDILTLYTDGDSAPGGRFAFLLSSVAGEEPPETDPVQPAKKGCFGAYGSFAFAALVLFVGVVAIAFAGKKNSFV